MQQVTNSIKSSFVVKAGNSAVGLRSSRFCMRDMFYKLLLKYFCGWLVVCIETGLRRNCLLHATFAVLSIQLNIQKQQKLRRRYE